MAMMIVVVVEVVITLEEVVINQFACFEIVFSDDLRVAFFALVMVAITIK